ncbi:MAG: sulfatase [Verrucomicrobiales bacterium]|nr:sulfatase [Verrucomicrobiales bacterium]|tara:strand:+ start:10110 stop:11945 length:1836 start_codon:yes stop_codon:yes gene_type:complete
MKKLLSALIAFTAFINVTAKDRPNILWLTSEDNSYHWIGCYGNKDAKTPNIDRIAAEGIRYRFGYANAPVCAVARFTMITGRYACSMGTQNMRSRYPIPEKFRTYPYYLREAGYYCVNRSKTDYNFKTDDKSHWDESSPRAHWKNRKPGQPFFAVFNTTISHESSLFQKKIDANRKKGLIPEKPSRDPSTAKLPPFMPDTPELREDWAIYMDVITAMDKQIGSWMKELEDAGELENTIIIHYSDHGGVLPRAKRYVYDTGTHVPMIVRVPKKWSHLAPAKSGSVSDRPVSFIDLPPTALSLAGIKPPEHMQGRPFLGDHQKKAEPFVFLFGQRFDSRMTRNVRALTDGKFRYIRNFHPHRHNGILAGYPHGQAGWRSFYALQTAGKTSAEQSSFWNIPQPVEELYDLANDPWEVNNLANDPAQKERLLKMRTYLMLKMGEIRDCGIVPESMYNKLSRDGTIYDYVHDKSFPHAQLLALAAGAGDVKLDLLKRLRRAMKAEHPVARYWGVLGCTIRGKSAKAAMKDIRKLQNDPVPAVQIAANEALVVLGNRKAGVRGLIKLLKETDDDMVALEAMNIAVALDILSDIPKDVWVRAAGIGNYPKRMLEDYPG